MVVVELDRGLCEEIAITWSANLRLWRRVCLQRLSAGVHTSRDLLSSSSVSVCFLGIDSRGGGLVCGSRIDTRRAATRGRGGRSSGNVCCASYRLRGIRLRGIRISLHGIIKEPARFLSDDIELDDLANGHEDWATVGFCGVRCLNSPNLQRLDRLLIIEMMLDSLELT